MKARKQTDASAAAAAGAEGASGAARLIELLLNLWAALAVLSWVLVVASLAGVRINKDALDRIGNIWLLIVAAGIGRGLWLLARRFRMAGV